MYLFMRIYVCVCINTQTQSLCKHTVRIDVLKWMD